jgi:chromate transporter
LIFAWATAPSGNGDIITSGRTAEDFTPRFDAVSHTNVSAAAPHSVTTTTLARVFLRLGVLGFGGPAAHIALMHEDLVRRRRWLSDAEFTDLLGATNLIPGPNSTEMAIHIGRRVAGWTGFWIAGLCFILPAAITVGILAFAYIRYGRTPDVRAVMNGVFPVILAVIAHATVQLSRTALRSAAMWIVAIGCAAFAFRGVHELVLLLAGGLLALASRSLTPARLAAALVIAAPAVLAAAAAARTAAVTLPGLALFFVKVGALLYGSGYVLVAFLRADLVERWLTDQQLLDAIAVGQITPGPLFTTATFIGAVLAGWPGAIVATIAIFLPAFLFVALTQPLIPCIRQSPAAGAFLDGVIAASLGLMAAVAARLGQVALDGWLAWSAFLVAFVVLVRWRVNSAWLIAAGAFAGFALSR